MTLRQTGEIVWNFMAKMKLNERFFCFSCLLFFTFIGTCWQVLVIGFTVRALVQIFDIFWLAFFFPPPLSPFYFSNIRFIYFFKISPSHPQRTSYQDSSSEPLSTHSTHIQTISSWRIHKHRNTASELFVIHILLILCNSYRLVLRPRFLQSLKKY